MLTSIQNKKKTLLLALALIIAILSSFMPAAYASNDGLTGANIVDGQLLGYYGDGGDIVIPNTVTIIGPEAFKDNDNVTSVTIPGSVSVIGYNAFEGCTALERVIFSDPVDGAKLTIRVSAFSYCPKLYDIEIPACAEYVTANVFKGCTSLEEIKVHPDNPYYFTDEYGVLFGPWVDYGEPQYDDPNLCLTAYPCGRAEGGYTIPREVAGRTVNQIWASGFMDAKNLTSIEIPETLEIIGGNAFEGSGLKEIVIPDTVTQIGASVFEDCTDLTDVTLPDGMTEIPMMFFYGCTSLARVNMPDTIRSFQMDSFTNCQSLTSLILPSGLTSLTLASFDGCTNLQRVVIPPSLINFPNDEYAGYYDPFPDSPRSLVVYVEEGSTAEKWAYNNIEDWGYSYEILSDVSNLDAIGAVPFYLIDMADKVKVEGTFPIDTTLKCTPVYSGAEYDVFSEAAQDSALQVYEISLLPEDTAEDGEYTLSIGLPEGFSNNAQLYRLDSGAAAAMDASMVSKTLSASTDTLGYFAVIDPSVPGGDTDDPVSVTLNKTSASMKVGEQIQLSATVKPSTVLDKTVSWKSSDSSVANVDSRGVVTAVAAGDAIITATASNGVDAQCRITVTDSSVEEGETIEASAALRIDPEKGEEGKSAFSLNLSDASRIATVQISFTSDAEEVTVVGQNGFTLIGSVKGSYSNGTYSGTAVLGYLTEDQSLFNCSSETEIAEIYTNSVPSTLQITEIKIAGWDASMQESYGELNQLSPDKATFEETLSYDVNEDGVVDLLDITAAQLYYRADADSDNWSEASKCDFNGDQVIDIQDYIDIWLNFSMN